MHSENPEPLEPKAPEILQKLKWLKMYGWRHKWYVLAGLIVTAVALGQGRLYSTWENVFRTKEKHVQQSSQRDSPITDVQTASGQIEKRFLTTGEGPGENLKALRGYSDSEREEQARSIYIGRWLQNAWTGSILALPKKSPTDGLWSISMDNGPKSRDGTGFEFTLLHTKQDASHLRPGMRIRVTGQIEEIRFVTVCLGDVSFEVVNKQ